MSSVFLTVLNMGIAASWIILAVLLLRLLLKKKAPKWVLCLLWALVAIRLVCPVTLESPFSLVPSGETIPAGIASSESPAIHSGISIVNSTVNPLLSKAFTPDPAAGANPLRIAVDLGAFLWLLGAAALLLYGGVSFLRLSKTVAASIPLDHRGKAPVLVCDDLASPFILGVIRPRIYVPSGLSKETLGHVLAHEQAHLRRRDHWWKPLGFLLLAIFWFQPLCWAAWFLLCRDIEMACDERVIRGMTAENRAAYSESLLACGRKTRTIAACPVAFGEVGVKERVKSVLHYKKPAFWILIVALLGALLLVVFFLTNPRRQPIDPGSLQIVSANTLDSRFGDPVDAELSREELDELRSRLASVHFEDANDSFEGLTPLYSLTVDTKNAGKLTFAVYDAAGEKIAMQCEKGTYPVRDAAFAGYLDKICAAKQRAAAVKTFTAAIVDIENGAVLVRPSEGSSELRSSNVFTIPTQHFASSYAPKIGDVVEIEYNDYILETYPAMLDQIYAVRVLPSQDSKDDSSLDPEILRAKYPEYFDLPTEDGLTVYVWQIAAGSYDFGLLPGIIDQVKWSAANDFADERPMEEIITLKPASMEEMKAILAAYDLPKEKIAIRPFQNPASSYLGPVFASADNTAYWELVKKLQEFFFPD